MKKVSPTFTLASPVREFTLSGQPAAEYVATDTIKTKSFAMPVRLRAILVPRGRFFFLIDMLSPIDEKSNEAFEKLVSSIIITPTPRSSGSK